MTYILSFIYTIKQIVYYAKSTTIYNYWYFAIATCFGLSLDHLQYNVLHIFCIYSQVFNVVSSCHAADGCLDWAWWNYSLATTIA